MKTKNIKVSGAFFAIASALLFSFGGVIVKFMPWHSLSINSMRNLVALIITIIYLKKIGHKFVFNRYVFLAGFAMMLTTTLYCVSNKLTTAANTILLQYTSPLFIILFSFIIFKSKPKKLDLLMCLAVGTGIICFFFDSLSTGNILGDTLALMSGCAYSIVFIANVMPKGDAISSFLVGEILSTIVGMPYLVQETDFSATALMGGLALGIIIGGGYVLMGLALRTVTPVATNLIGTIEPVLNPVWVAIFYHEMLTPLALVGFVIVLVSVVLYNLAPRYLSKR